jgi:hypothetical protein
MSVKHTQIYLNRLPICAGCGQQDGSRLKRHSKRRSKAGSTRAGSSRKGIRNLGALLSGRQLSKKTIWREEVFLFSHSPTSDLERIVSS